MERFVQLVAGGGVVTVAGLWVVALSAPWTGRWALGTALAVLGSSALLAGIGTEIDLRGA